MENENLEQFMQRLDKRLDEIQRLTLLQTKKALTVEDVANLTGYSKAYIYKLTSEGRLHYYKPNGKAIYFDRDEIECYMLSNRVDAVADSEQKAIDYELLRERCLKLTPAEAAVWRKLQKATDLLNEVFGDDAPDCWWTFWTHSQPKNRKTGKRGKLILYEDLPGTYVLKTLAGTIDPNEICKKQ